MAPVADRADPAGAEHAATNGFDVGPGGKEEGRVGARFEVVHHLLTSIGGGMGRERMVGQACSIGHDCCLSCRARAIIVRPTALLGRG